MKRLVHFPQGPVNHYKSFQSNLKIKNNNDQWGWNSSYRFNNDRQNKSREQKSNTAQLCVFDKRLARAWMQ